MSDYRHPRIAFVVFGTIVKKSGYQDELSRIWLMTISFVDFVQFWFPTPNSMYKLWLAMEIWQFDYLVNGIRNDVSKLTFSVLYQQNWISVDSLTFLTWKIFGLGVKNGIQPPPPFPYYSQSFWKRPFNGVKLTFERCLKRNRAPFPWGTREFKRRSSRES